MVASGASAAIVFAATASDAGTLAGRALLWQPVRASASAARVSATSVLAASASAASATAASTLCQWPVHWLPKHASA